MSYQVQHGGYSFTLEYESSVGDRGQRYELRSYLPKTLSDEGMDQLRRLLEHDAEAVWVQSRLMALFSFVDPNDEGPGKTMPAVCLRGWEKGGEPEDGVLFMCREKEGRSYLNFPAKLSGDEADKMAKAFWGLLLADANDLEDYEGAVKTLKAGLVPYGVRDGRCFFGEETEAVEPDGEELKVGKEDDWLEGAFYGEDDDDEFEYNNYGFGEEDDDDDDDY